MIRKSSIQIYWYLCTILFDRWWQKFFLWFRIFSWTFATIFFCLARSLVPFSNFDSFLYVLTIAFSLFLKKRGFSIISPLDMTAKWFNPISRAIAFSFIGNGFVATSQENMIFHFPLDSLFKVHVLIVPSIGLCKLRRMDPILANLISEPIKEKPDCG